MVAVRCYWYCVGSERLGLVDHSTMMIGVMSVGVLVVVVAVAVVFAAFVVDPTNTIVIAQM